MKKKAKIVNFSLSHKKYVKKLRQDKFIVIFFRIFVLVAFLGLWELLTYTNVLDPFFVSSPSRIIAQLGDMIASGTLWHHTWVTLYETLIGFFIATVLGYLIAVLLWWNEKVRKILNKDLDFLDSIQTETSTARQFLFIARCKSSKSENVLQKANRVEKIISDQGFEVTRMKKADIKRFLAIYFEASTNGDLMPDFDGEQYFEKEQTYEET